MTILEIIKAMAPEVSIEVPSAAVANPDREMVEAVHFATMACEEIERRGDWGRLQTTYTLTGDGTAQTFSLPDDFSRLQAGNAIIYQGHPVRGGLSADEWNSLTFVEGTPRFFRLIGNAIELWPFLALGETATVKYLSKNWNSNGSAVWSTDSDVAVFPGTLILKGAIWRWRRQKAMDYQDHQAEYEAALKDFAGFDDRSRTP